LGVWENDRGKIGLYAKKLVHRKRKLEKVEEK
jgi:hypothetical protein